MSNNIDAQYEGISRSKPTQSSYDSYTGRYKILNPKQRLLNMVCACLIKEPSFFDDLVFEMPSRHWQTDNSHFIWLVKFVMDFNDCSKHELLDLVFKVSRRDPEYVLKLAFYVRNDLGIRSTANFLLAAASACPESRSTFLKYYHRVIRLPSDWLEVCSFYVVIRRHLLRRWMAYHPNQTKILKTVLSVKEKAKIEHLLHEFKFDVVPGRDLPKVLQQAMREKFLDFDVYQLGKYNKENSIKRKFLKKTYNERKKPGRAMNEDGGSGWGGAIRVSWRGRGMSRGRPVQRGRYASRGRVSLQPDKNDGEEMDSAKDLENAYNSEDSEEAINSDNDSDIEEKQTSSKKEVKKRQPTTELSKKPQFTMKKMVRMLHISEPKEYVLGLLGKKYPGSEQEFLELGLNKPPLSRSISSKNRQELERVFDKSKSGARMKLPIPETWETELSAKGNLASTWEGLLDSGKLPFMAMLRNLRNLITTGVSPKHHHIVLDKLSDANTIKHSNQFPFRFFSAYQAIDVDLKKLKKLKKGSEEYLRKQEVKLGKKMLVPEYLPDAELIDRYRSALDQAVQHAVTNNIKEVKGNSVVLIDVSESMKTSVCSSAKAGNFTSSIEIGVLLGLMCHFVCQKSELLIYSSPSLIWPDENYQNMTQGLKDEKILSNMRTVLQRAAQMGAVRQFPISYFEHLIENKIFVDQAIVISDMKWDDRNIQSDSALISRTIGRYRKVVNPNFLFICIDLFGSGNSLVNMNEGEKDPRNISITGFSDQILRFVAEKSDDAQLRYVQNIDKVKKVELPELLVSEHKPSSNKGNRKRKNKKSKAGSKSKITASHVKNQVLIIREDSTTLLPSIRDKNIVQVISKTGHCFFLTDDGCVYGIGRAGSIFLKNTEQASLLFSSDMLKQQTNSKSKNNIVEYVTYMTCGNEHLVVLTNKGNVFAMGSNSDNQLGMVTETDYLSEMKQVFANLEVIPKITRVACGSFYTLLVDSNGILYGCGRNTHHQLGNISTDGPVTKLYQSPRRIVLGENVGKIVDIAAGGSHSAIIDVNGSLWMMGNNSHGQCGVGKLYGSVFNPIKISIFNEEKVDNVKIRSVSCGEYHTATLTTDGQMYVFGNGIHGQLGINTVSDNESSPYLVHSYHKNFIQSVECSRYYTIAMTKSGRLYTCGCNPSGHSDNPRNMLPTVATSFCSRRVLHASYGDEYKVIITESRSLLSKSMLQMVNDDQFFDMRLRISSTLESVVNLQLHRYVLDGRCPLLLSTLCTRTTNDVQDPNNPVCYELKLEGACEGVLMKSVIALIEYIYTGEVNFYHNAAQTPEFEVSSKSEWDNLKKLASKVQLDTLVELCANRHLELSRDHIMTNTMEAILSNKESTYDCLLRIEGQTPRTIRCHSAILAYRSEYFRSALLFDRAEKGTMGKSQFGFTTSLTLDDVDDTQAVEVILAYIYTGTINESLINEGNALDILRLAHKFCLVDLQEEMENLIMRYITVSNVSVILECADFYEWNILRQFLIHYIIRDDNTEAVYEQNSFRELKRNNVLLADEIKRFKKQETKRRQQHYKHASMLTR